MFRPSRAICLGLVVIGVGTGEMASARPVSPAVRALNREFRRLCPEKRLEQLSPFRLEYQAEVFDRRLSSEQQRQKAVIIGLGSSDYPHCRDGDVSCPASENVRAYRSMGLLTPFATQVCAAFKYCTSAAARSCETVAPVGGD